MIFLCWYLSVAVVLSWFKVLTRTAQGFWKVVKGKQLMFFLALKKNEKIYIAEISFRISNNFLLLVNKSENDF